MISLMKFEWDDDKNRSNIEKHGISFEMAKSIFETEHISTIDDRKDYGELRISAKGFLEGVMIMVTYTVRGSKIRIISARRANKKERGRSI